MAGLALRRVLALVALLAIPAPGAFLEGQEFRWLAFGDSITLGNYDFQELGGYPGRLTTLLGCTPGVCEVFNAGNSGEKTAGGVTRIDTVFDDDGPFDVMMLMEGTNDIFRNRSVELAVANLGIMAAKARIRGTDTVHASIIWYHPDGEFGTSKDDEVLAVRDGVENLSITYSRYFVDIWDVLCPDSHGDYHGHNQNQCFNRHYSDVCPGTPPPCGDNRGHPIGSGYSMMATAFYNGLLAVPVPGAPLSEEPTGVVLVSRPTFEWQRETPVRATWYRLIVEGDAGVAVDKWVEARGYCDPTSCAHRIFSTEQLSEGDYTWRVQARNPAGLGPWSAETSFTVLSSGIFADDFESGDTSAWPPEG